MVNVPLYLSLRPFFFPFRPETIYVFDVSCERNRFMVDVFPNGFLPASSRFPRSLIFSLFARVAVTSFIESLVERRCGFLTR